MGSVMVAGWICVEVGEKKCLGWVGGSKERLEESRRSPRRMCRRKHGVSSPARAVAGNEAGSRNVRVGQGILSRLDSARYLLVGMYCC